MKKYKPYILILLQIWLSSCSIFAQGQNKQGLSLFTDRDFCISGDTLWFKVVLAEILSESENIVHVQLDSPDRNLITSVIKMCNNHWAEGYLYIPDSLSTGVYFLSAFQNSYRINPEIETEIKTLFVYNRFLDNLFEIVIPEIPEKINADSYAAGIQIKTEKSMYNAREKVDVDISLDNSFKSKVSDIVLKAGIVDELASEMGGRYRIRCTSYDRNIPVIKEKDGFILSGTVTDKNGNPQSGILVLLSIPGKLPYLDYFVTGENGDFHFYIRNAEGNATVVLQACSKSFIDVIIKIQQNHLVSEDGLAMTNKILSENQFSTINSAVRGNFYNRLFRTNLVMPRDTFNMQHCFNIPFYGVLYNEVIPGKFMDLPDFQEISRELLPGVQYRIKNKEVTFRIINNQQNVFFNFEPLRLLNGIPVFNNNLIASLKSTDIEYIRIVKLERLFGDLLINGVLDISLVDKSYVWLANQPNTFLFDIPCLQPDKKINYGPALSTCANTPDLRQVYFFKVQNCVDATNFEFQLSDVSGKVEIAVEAVDENQEFVKISKIIEVK